MKKLFILLLLTIIILPISNTLGQDYNTPGGVLYEENFDYPVGDTLVNHGTWIHHSGSGRSILISAGNLSYPTYPASGIGNSIPIEGGPGSAEDAHATFNPTDTTGCVFIALLVKFDSAGTAGDYFFHLTENPNSFNYRGRVFARDDGAGNLEFGLRFGSAGTVQWSSSSYAFGDTILLVLKYVYAGDLSSSDDTVKLFINPDISAPEPPADLVHPAENSDIQVGAVAFRQGGVLLFAQADGIRVTNLWGSIVPVELTSFTAFVGGNTVTLNWSTATELNNSGFDILRQSAQDGQNNQWEKIAFIAGYGTTTETRNYSFVDNNLAVGQYSYRLKQIDFDGTSELSDVVNVEVINPAQFDLSQNYPNPFNPSTTIKFSLPEASNVTLKVFNTLGEEVTVLVNRIMEAGTHEVNFEASQLQSGIYFYRLEAGTFSQVKKLTLLK